MSKFLLCIFAVLFLFSVEPSFAVETEFKENIAKASAILGDSDLVNVSIEIIEPPKGYVYGKAYMWGGDETSPPKKIIKAITVVRNGQMVFIPLSAYVDLGNPKAISLQKRPAHGFRLIINGGDAAGSYSAMLDFKNNEISRRK